MDDSNLSSEIDGLLAALEAPAASASPASAGEVTRFVVATSWEDAAVPLTVLRAFINILPDEVPAQLVFAVPHEPTQQDVECVRVLLEGLDKESFRGNLHISSFDEVGAAPYDSAVVADGDPGSLVQQVGGVITRMHDIVRRHDAASSTDANPGDQGALRERLARFSG